MRLRGCEETLHRCFRCDGGRHARENGLGFRVCDHALRGHDLNDRGRNGHGRERICCGVELLDLEFHVCVLFHGDALSISSHLYEYAHVRDHDFASFLLYDDALLSYAYEVFA